MAPVPVVAPPSPASAAGAGVVPGPAIESLPLTEAQAAAALAGFRNSCASLVRRADLSGLTQGADWQPACTAARTVPAGGARAFFATYLEAVQVGDGKAFATGYYIPTIAGSRDRREGYETPVYGRPRDLIDVDLGAFNPELAGKAVRGRVEGSKLVPYFDRTQIEEGALHNRAPIIAWAADPVELFFLQVQGSGELQLPDGGTMRIGYDTQNGRGYTGIGKLMLDRGLVDRSQASMQGLVAWLHAHPEEGRQVMRENKSYVFFRELAGAPLGALGLPVLGQVTVAADPKFIPLGAPVFLSMDRADANGLWVAQDTGGAIRGPNRVDTFWGAGADARAIAGGMSARGTAFLFLPRGTAARLAGSRPAPRPDLGAALGISGGNGGSSAQP
ncbi:hypothetical protein DVW87_03875 [Sphingomonas aracearum]|uniref:peptidoglycan lytic exotransglycosylase n=2 Tax=Sphingomonas aracearum TaxID=2283317 RepID=A0A369W2H0_9SPHN|nr:murein transglycosylase A [Sphingomonas aracearum]RDE07472.1 hypothetical protein DVW87_03875 [Sphingomonas aracearum]